MASAAVADPLGLSPATFARSAASSAAFIRIDARDLGHQSTGVLLLAARGTGRGTGLAHVVAQLAVLEKDVHRLPERVVQDLDQLLVDERMG